jgi:transcriptional regulator
MAEIPRRDEIPPGTLYMLILKVLVRHGELHGYEIANSIQRISDDVLQVEEGSLYPALQRMLLKGWVTAEWGVTAGNRRARYYRPTAAGRKQLNAEMEQYQRVNGAIQKVLQTA